MFLPCAEILLTIGLISSVIIGRARCSNEDELWQSFKRNYNKVYDNPEEDLAINQFGDRSDEELNEPLNGFIPPSEGEGREWLKPQSELEMWQMMGLNPDEFLPTPENESYFGDYGLVGPVLDQGVECRSCWAFATAGLIEGQQRYYVNNSKAVIALSTQQLLDCDGKINRGCKGGNPIRALQYLVARDNSNGMVRASDYPYTGKDGRPCRVNSSSSFRDFTTQIANGIAVIPNDEQLLKLALDRYGPLAVAIDASNLFFYSSGIYNDPRCQPTKPNHAVLLVGYGSEECIKSGTKKDYWVVKNSWGENWGENGLFRLERNASNACGVATYPMAVSFKIPRIHY